jgi:hypothetical protein
MAKKTWEREFLEAFTPCALSRIHAHANNLTDEDAKRLRLLLVNEENPTEAWLEKVFPVMFPGLRDFAREHDLDMRKVETVQSFCRYRAETVRAAVKTA